MNLKNKKVLVTGAEGFIGSHLTESLIQQGAEVTALVQYNSFNNWGWIETFSEDIKSQIKIYTGDIREYDSISKVVKGQEVVMHLAALIAIPYSYLSPAAYVRTNVEGTLNVMQASLDHGVQKVVHTSTSEVYGSAQYVPINELHPLQGQSPYSASKIGADKIAESFYRSFELPVATIRPFNTYGPRQSARAVIPTIITQALAGEKIKLGSMHPTRDFTYVKDTVEGFIKVAAAANSVGEVINIGSNYEVSIGDLVKKIVSLTGCEVEVEFDDQRTRPQQSEVNRLWADNSKAKKLLGWELSYSIDQGLMETISWFKNNLKGYKTDIYNV